jgi:cysteine desulfurase/selenocysteine lyase
MSIALAGPFDHRSFEQLRSEFPVLAETAGRPLHFLDNAATTQKPRSVIEAIRRCMETGQGPIHRGLYPLAESATNAYEGARASVARFINAARADQVVFTRSATESINMVAWGWLRPRLRPGDRVWVTRMEHHANFLPWQRVCRETDAQLRIVELHEDGSLNLEAATGLLDERTRMIALCQVSNVLGVENSVRRICQLAAAAGIPILVDAAQSVSHMSVDVGDLGCDFLAFSAHKMYGPAGIGALFGRSEHLAEMQPLLLGGGMVDRVEEHSAQWTQVPDRFEAGSPNLAGAVGLAAAIDWLSAIGMQRVQAHGTELAQHTRAALAEIPGLRLVPTPGKARSAIVSFVVDGVHPHDIAQIAGERGVAVRAGHHCCQPLMRHLGLAATARASFGVYNGPEDVAALVDAVREAVDLLR